MSVVAGGFLVAKAAQGFDDRALRLGLAGINDVVNLSHIAEVGMVFIALHGGNPAVVLIGIAIELAVGEIAAEQTELPHVVGDVFTHVADCTVGADDYLLVFLGDSLYNIVLALVVETGLFPLSIFI